MHVAQLAKKRQMALEVVTSSTGRLADFFGIDQDQVLRITAIRHSDPQVQNLWRLQQIARVLDLMADKVGQPDQPPNNALPRQAADTVLAECPGLSKKSAEAIQKWAKGEAG